MRKKIARKRILIVKKFWDDVFFHYVVGWIFDMQTNEFHPLTTFNKENNNSEMKKSNEDEHHTA